VRLCSPPESDALLHPSSISIEMLCFSYHQKASLASFDLREIVVAFLLEKRITEGKFEACPSIQLASSSLLPFFRDHEERELAFRTESQNRSSMPATQFVDV
jgi:hypothetical protein